MKFTSLIFKTVKNIIKMYSHELIKLFIELLSLIRVTESCSYILTKIVDEVDTSSNYLYPWLVTIRKLHTFDYRLGYGSLIRINMVITSAKVTYGYTEKDLAVETNCQSVNEFSGDFYNCATRYLHIIFYPSDMDESKPEQSYTLIFLKSPFFRSARINTIPLVKSVDDINVNKCYFIRLMRETGVSDNRTALVTSSYNTSYTEDSSLNMDKFNLTQLKVDKDWIVSFDVFSKCLQTLCHDYETPMSFLGSPLFCELKSTTNSHPYGLVGIGTFNLWTPNNATNISEVKHAGSIVTLIDKYEGIAEIFYLIRTAGLKAILCMTQKTDLKYCWKDE